MIELQEDIHISQIPQIIHFKFNTMFRKSNQVFKSTKFAVNTKGELITTSIKSPLKETIFTKSHEIWQTNKELLKKYESQPYVVKGLINYFMKHI